MRRPCACGGTVDANNLDPAPGVQLHQRTEPHASWRLHEYPEPEPTAPMSARDLSSRIRVRPSRREVLVGLGYDL